MPRDMGESGWSRGQSVPRLVSLRAGYSLNDATYRNFVQPDPVTGEHQNLRGKQV